VAAEELFGEFRISANASKELGKALEWHFQTEVPHSSSWDPFRRNRRGILAPSPGTARSRGVVGEEPDLSDKRTASFDHHSVSGDPSTFQLLFHPHLSPTYTRKPFPALGAVVDRRKQGRYREVHGGSMVHPRRIAGDHDYLNWCIITLGSFVQGSSIVG
jgi:hypothetical protein